ICALTRGGATSRTNWGGGMVGVAVGGGVGRAVGGAIGGATWSARPGAASRGAAFGGGPLTDTAACAVEVKPERLAAGGSAGAQAPPSQSPTASGRTSTARRERTVNSSDQSSLTAATTPDGLAGRHHLLTTVRRGQPGPIIAPAPAAHLWNAHRGRVTIPHQEPPLAASGGPRAPRSPLVGSVNGHGRPARGAYGTICGQP